jgi:hypothetical protein
MTREDIAALAQADRDMVALLGEIVGAQEKRHDPEAVRDLANRYEATKQTLDRLIKPGVIAALAELALSAPERQGWLLLTKKGKRLEVTTERLARGIARRRGWRCFHWEAGAWVEVPIR